MLSVIMPVYNAEKFLSRCIESLRKQTYRDWELLAVIDGATDGSRSLLEGYAVRDARIKVIVQENAGVSSARNRGLDEAAGEYITFLDADDWIEPDVYERMIRHFAADVDIDIVVAGFVRDLDGKAMQILERGKAFVTRAEAAVPELFRNRRFRGELCDKAYRRSLFDGLRLAPDISIAEDLLINYQLFQRARKISYEPIWGYHYVVNNESVCHIYSKKNLSHIKAVERMMALPAPSPYVERILKGTYGRALSSHILRMIQVNRTLYCEEIVSAQKKLRRNFFQHISAPALSMRQRAGIAYAALPLKACIWLSGIAQHGQRGL